MKQNWFFEKKKKNKQNRHPTGPTGQKTNNLPPHKNGEDKNELSKMKKRT